MAKNRTDKRKENEMIKGVKDMSKTKHIKVDLSNSPSTLIGAVLLEESNGDSELVELFNTKFKEVMGDADINILEYQIAAVNKLIRDELLIYASYAPSATSDLTTEINTVLTSIKDDAVYSAWLQHVKIGAIKYIVQNNVFKQNDDFSKKIKEHKASIDTDK